MNDVTPTVAQALDVLDAALGHAGALGVSAAEASLSAGGGLSLTVRNGELESIEHHQDKGLSLTVYRGQRKGTATTTDFSDASLRETAAAAERIARYGEEDPYAGLIDARYLATTIPDLDLDHPWRIEPDAALDIALRCDAAARDQGDAIEQVDDVSVNQHRGLRGYATTDGFAAAYHGTRHSVSCVCVGKDKGRMQRAHWYSLERDADALESAESIGERAAARTLARLGARKVKTAKVPVIFEAPVAAGLIGHLVSAVSGGSLYRRASFLLDHLGKQVFPDWMRIHEQPHLARALGSAAFDSEGVATRARDLVSEGVLQGYVLDSYAARKLDMQTTGNAGGVHNLTVEPGPDGLDHEGLLREMGNGLLVTELMGMGVNITTGDYSRGVAGFWVEDGEVREPVEEITIAGNLRDMFARVRQIGTDVDPRGNIRTGSVLLDGMTVAGE